MSKAERTRQYIIEKTAAHFNKTGYENTSISEICGLTGLTKGSIYGNFKDKEELAAEVFLYNASNVKRIADHVFSKGGSSASQLKKWLDHYRRNWSEIISKGGCPMLNAAVEVDDSSTHLRKRVRLAFKVWKKMIREVIENGVESGEFKKKTEPEKYASLIVMLLEGGMLLSGLEKNNVDLFLAIDRIEDIIDHELMKRKDHR